MKMIPTYDKKNQQEIQRNNTNEKIVLLGK